MTDKRIAMMVAKVREHVLSTPHGSAIDPSIMNHMMRMLYHANKGKHAECPDGDLRRGLAKQFWLGWYSLQRPVNLN